MLAAPRRRGAAVPHRRPGSVRPPPDTRRHRRLPTGRPAGHHRRTARLVRARGPGPDPPYIDTITVDADRHLVLPPRRPNGYGNHSCDPNLWWVGPYDLAARRDIAAGEELTNDYATSTAEPGFVLPCACDTPLCRRTVTGTDWQRPDLQERYGPHWVPALLTRITPPR
ncbi:SET domain-containing protein-lysine N-methyltransferase [Paractinoplanes rishiriensis]|uniref:SET domain-containing protein-lysine N-methyltransferase n=1 Tax=Paractinoplanes rishiriensis TaxID=1050105 RepID=UPI001944F650